MGATPILVIRDKRSQMIHADCVRCTGSEDEFPIETTTKWIFGLGYPEVIIRTDGASSIVALSRRVGEKLREAGIKTMHNTSPAYDSRSAGHAESGVRIAKEKVRTLICFARECTRCDCWVITCFTPMVCKICMSNYWQISPWNRWNDRPSQSLRSLETATSICAVV